MAVMSWSTQSCPGPLGHVLVLSVMSWSTQSCYFLFHSVLLWSFGSVVLKQSYPAPFSRALVHWVHGVDAVMPWSIGSMVLMQSCPGPLGQWC